MARTIEEVRLELTSGFVSNSVIQQLYNLTSTTSFDAEFSKVSFEAIFFHFLATAISTVEKLFDTHKQWIETRAKELKWGQLPWYGVTAKKFQFGSALEWIDDEYKYVASIPTAQIVKLAAANSNGGHIFLKVANLDGSGNIITLTPTELTSFSAYMAKVKPPGVNLSCVSRTPDLLMIHYRVYIDPLLLATNGSLLTDPSVFPVEDAINDYIKNLDFNGKFSVTQLTDRIQEKGGVNNPVFESVQAKFGTYNYSAFNDYYTPNAGYLKVDTAHPLSTTITYINQ